MTLQPRRSMLAQAMEEFLEVNPGYRGRVLDGSRYTSDIERAGVPIPVLSIWRMELPNESYRAPRAAFWWVSNEGRASASLPGSGRA